MLVETTDTEGIMTTAYRYWDGVWRDPAGRQDWECPSSWVTAVAREWRNLDVMRVLDLGCGVGRHCAALDRLGFTVTGLDRSEAACTRAREVCAAAGADVTVVHSGFDALPFPADHFDAVLAYNVVYHGHESDLRTVLSEILRVLTPGGRYAGTMLSKRNSQWGRGTEVSPNTFVQKTAEDDKTHPHLYCNAADLVRLHGGFEVRGLLDSAQSRPGSEHWFCEFEAGGLRGNSQHVEGTP